MRHHGVQRALLAIGALLAAPAGRALAQPMELDLVDTLAGCAAGEVEAGVTIGNTNPTSDPFDVGYRFTVEPEGVWLAQELTVCASSASAAHHLQDFSLRADDGGVPGDLLYAFDLDLPADPSLVSAVASVRPAELVSGASYWLVAERDLQRGVWWRPVPSAGTTERAQREGDDPWQVTVQPLPQLRLRVLPESSATALAALLAIAALAFRSRRAGRRWGVLAGIALLAPPLAARAEIAVEFASFGTYTADSFGACRVSVSTPDAGALLSIGPGGLGVQGGLGTDAAALDGGESLAVVFPVLTGIGATDVSYRVDAAGNENGSGPAGEAFLEAFDSMGESLGVRAVSGAGTHDVSALFADAPIQFLLLTAAGDSQRIGQIAFTPAAASGTILALEGFGFVITSSFEICDVAITGSADVVLTAAGLGISGGNSPSLLEGSEWVRFDFEQPHALVSYRNTAASDGNGNGTVADAFVEGYGAGGVSLGLVSVHGEGIQDVTALFGGVPLTGFRVVANVDAQRVSSVVYAPDAGAAAAGTAALAALALVAVRRKR